ncbi:hypothetical protein ASL11_34955 [Paenibacillus sp. Soil750]|nr:hypothetical protein ASL11_34955 [Paenibacillus sp. Soil750]
MINAPNSRIEKIMQKLSLNEPLISNMPVNINLVEQAQKFENLKRTHPINEADKTHKLRILMQNLPPNHPLIQMMEGNLKQVKQAQRSEKLRKILPLN